MHIDYIWSEDFFREYQRKIFSMWEQLNSQTWQLAQSCNRDIISKIKMQIYFDEVAICINKLNKKTSNILNILLEYIDAYIEICNEINDTNKVVDDRIPLSIDEFVINDDSCEGNIISGFDNMVYALKSYLNFIQDLKEFEKTFEGGFRSMQDEYELVNGVIDSIREIDETIWKIEDLLSGLEDKRWEIIPLAPPPNF